LDESGFAVDSPRERGYSSKGENCFSCKDWHARGRINAIGAISNFKLINVCLGTFRSKLIFYIHLIKTLQFLSFRNWSVYFLQFFLSILLISLPTGHSYPIKKSDFCF
jgi:hypothetical protein